MDTGSRTRIGTMDDTLKVEFPLGDFKIVVSEPTDGQLFALALSRTSKDADRERLIRRLIRVLEMLTGPEQWYDIIEDALISGDLTPEALVKLASDVFEFPWKEHHKPQPAPAGTNLAPGEPLTEVVPASGPRVVSGG